MVAIKTSNYTVEYKTVDSVLIRTITIIRKCKTTTDFINAAKLTDVPHKLLTVVKKEM